MTLLTMMAVVTVAIVVQRNLFAVVVFGSIYSFLMATALVALDAVDVAMTEASVGAGMSTVLLLAALHLTRAGEIKPLREILDQVERTHGGQLIEAELETEHGRMLYELKLLTREGRVVKLLYDARTGQPLPDRGPDRRK